MSHNHPRTIHNPLVVHTINTHDFEEREHLKPYLNRRLTFDGVLIATETKYSPTYPQGFINGTFVSINCNQIKGVSFHHLNIILPRNHKFQLFQRYQFTAIVYKYFQAYYVRQQDGTRSLVSRPTYSIDKPRNICKDDRTDTPIKLSKYLRISINYCQRNHPHFPIKKVNAVLRTLPDNGSRERYLNKYITKTKNYLKSQRS